MKLVLEYRYPGTIPCYVNLGLSGSQCAFDLKFYDVRHNETLAGAMSACPIRCTPLYL
jgi:hypothetical protein